MEEVQSFRAAFKASFGSGGAGGDISSSQRELMASSHVELHAQVTAGRIEPPQSLTLTSFDQIVGLLESLRNEQIKLFRAPLEIIAKSYWHTLIQYPKTRALLAENQGSPAVAPWGVPTGTVIAWFPPPSSLRRDAAGNITIIPPSGWAVCDGTQTTPNLSDRFIMGTGKGQEIGVTGGASNHRHTGIAAKIAGHGNRTLEPPYPGADFFPTFDHVHSVNTDFCDNIPPFTKLIYIMKL